MSGVQEGLTKLFVGGIQPTCKEQDLRAALSDYCEYIAKIDIKMKNNFLNRGYAFIFVNNPAIADKMTKMKFKFGDRILQIQNINKNSREKEEYKLKRLYLKNLPAHTTDRELYSFFETFGEVRSSYIIKDRFGQYRDYGFIDFEHVEDVDVCLEHLKTTPFVLRGTKVKVRRFIKLDDKKDEDDELENDDVATHSLLSSGIIRPLPSASPFAFGIQSPQAESWVNYPLYPGLPTQHYQLQNQDSIAAYNDTYLPYTKTVRTQEAEAGHDENLYSQPTCPGTPYSSPQMFYGLRKPLKTYDIFSNDSSDRNLKVEVNDTTEAASEIMGGVEVDYKYLVQRDYLSYFMSVDNNHSFTNIRINRRCNPSSTSPALPEPTAVGAAGLQSLEAQHPVQQ